MKHKIRPPIMMVTVKPTSLYGAKMYQAMPLIFMF